MQYYGQTQDVDECTSGLKSAEPKNALHLVCTRRWRSQRLTPPYIRLLIGLTSRRPLDVRRTTKVQEGTEQRNGSIARVCFISLRSKSSRRAASF